MEITNPFIQIDVSIGEDEFKAPVTSQDTLLIKTRLESSDEVHNVKINDLGPFVYLEIKIESSKSIEETKAAVRDLVIQACAGLLK